MVGLASREKAAENRVWELGDYPLGVLSIFRGSTVCREGNMKFSRNSTILHSRGYICRCLFWEAVSFVELSTTLHYMSFPEGPAFFVFWLPVKPCWVSFFHHPSISLGEGRSPHLNPLMLRPPNMEGSDASGPPPGFTTFASGVVGQGISSRMIHVGFFLWVVFLTYMRSDYIHGTKYMQ